MGAPLIWINGYPGSGKLTIARALLVLYGMKKAILVHNHQLIDPVEARTPRTHPDYDRQRQLERSRAFFTYVESLETSSQIIIFTDFQSNNELGRSVAQEYKSAARRSGRFFFPVYLTCDVEENLCRVATAERVSSGTGKLLSREVLQDIRSRCDLFRFGDGEELTIDVTDASPTEAAQRILAHIDYWKQICAERDCG
ncbi:MAG: hypothetical protein M1816_006933 [Peltula sp. TS41687]|nr:MAG: hypothetical protein M1816_006933 [Peltula sp. TS41687]